MAEKALTGDQVTIAITIAVEPAVAFRVFTEETDLWWQRGPAYRAGGRNPGTLCFEPRSGGRLFESFKAPDGEQLVEFGRITVWDPPSLLMFEWRSVTFAPGERTEVEVRFEPIATGTRVTVIHRGWAALRPDHPVRHGQPAPAFIGNLGMWWTRLLKALREQAEKPK
jgi:uncharacterized protein YndB with AHSA1/START domain